MTLATQPKRMVIMGAGAIGVEFAYFYNAFGTEVTLIEMMSRVLPVEDDEISATLLKSFTKQGVKVLTSTKVEKTEVTKTGVKVTVKGEKGDAQVIEADVLLVAIGVTPVLPGGLEFKKDARGYLQTDENYMTNVPGVYAGGRHHRRALAGACGQLGGAPVHRGDFPREETAQGERVPGLHVLPAAGGQRRADRARRQGRGD